MATTTKSKFGRVVSARLLANKLAGRKPDSIRGLAKLIAKGDEDQAKTVKRSLNRWSSPVGPKPSPYSRTLVAHHLEIDASELDDEEDDPAVLFATLFDRAIDKRVDQRLKAIEAGART